MSQLVQFIKTRIVVIAIVVALVAGATVAILLHEINVGQVQTQTNAQHKLTQITYHGKNGVDALTLLKDHAQVQIKHYSFGDFVTAIDGTVGNGPKYWTLYVNNKESSVGASSYITKTGDIITWKLQ